MVNDLYMSESNIENFLCNNLSNRDYLKHFSQTGLSLVTHTWIFIETLA